MLEEGAAIVDGPAPQIPARTLGHVTSSYDSPTLGRSIALALVRGGATRMGERVHLSMQGGRTVTATIANPVFFDPQSERQNA